ncbi:MAG: Methane oxygenase PmoA, partial [Bacilli bacterium]|nr:Methane oxygenase PmoA [Bacilli bacterium]
NIKVQAGAHPRDLCPVSFKMSKDSFESGIQANFRLTGAQGQEVALQWTDEGDAYLFYWIVSGLSAGEGQIYQLQQTASAQRRGVELIPGENKIDIHVGGEFFTSYIYDRAVAKPYLGPIIGPYGDSYTRLDFDIKEHPHHRSLWLAIGDVNGVDMWNEPSGSFGKQLHQAFTEQISGPVFGRFTANNIWASNKERAIIDESRTITIYQTPASGRFVDIDVTFRASYDQVEFGATKEAGPLGIRVAESMKVANGGTMVNSYGAVGEQECWGERAQWCDYHGPVGGHVLGIAAFDNKQNEHYPTHWHIRNYGLLAANNFYFKGGKLLKKGDVVQYNYRVYFHDGDTAQAQVADRFQDYANPPKLELVQ